MPAEISIERAEASDMEAIRSLVREADLPCLDLGRANQAFFVARSSGALVGCVGLERYGQAALLRSLAVSPARRGEGLSFALFQRVAAEARSLAVVELYLLTATAEALFARWGFRRVPREHVPEAVRGSAEFASLCPATAACMVLALPPG
jgi:amino-acid N-acetyltransferase